MVSGRDRDPGYRKKTTKPVVKKASAVKPTPAPPKKEEQEPAPVTTPSPAPAPAPAPKETPKVVAPITPVKETKKPDPVVSEPPVKKSSEDKQDNSENKPAAPPVVPPEKKPNPHKTSRKSKLLGILIALIFIIGLAALGYMVISSIMEKETIEKLDNSFIDDGVKSTGPNSTDAISDGDENGTSSENGEDTPQDGAIGMDVENVSEGENSEETDLSSDNSMESEMIEAKEEHSEKSVAEQEKEAIKTKIIRKKGEFELPSWIIAFSANSKKPLANTNYSTLEALGYDAGIYWIPKYFPGGSEMYKVYVGPYKSAIEAASMLPAIKNLQPDAYVMKIEE